MDARQRRWRRRAALGFQGNFKTNSASPRCTGPAPPRLLLGDYSLRAPGGEPAAEGGAGCGDWLRGGEGRAWGGG